MKAAISHCLIQCSKFNLFFKVAFWQPKTNWSPVTNIGGQEKRALLEISFGRHIDISRFHTATNEDKRNKTITHCHYYKDNGGQIIFPANVYLT